MSKHAQAINQDRTAEPSVELLLDAAREAEVVLEQEARSHPTYADVRHRLGLLRLLRQDPPGAEREFEEALGINPGYRAAYYGLRLARLVQGMPLERLKEPAPQTAVMPEEWAWEWVDQAYHRLTQGEDATEGLPTPRNREEQLLQHHYAGFFALRLGNDERATEHFRAAASLSLITRGALERLDVAPWARGGERGLEDALQGLLWSPLAEDLYAYLGRIYARNGLRDEALDCYERAYLVFPRDARHAMFRAEVAMAFGRRRRRSGC